MKRVYTTSTNTETTKRKKKPKLQATELLGNHYYDEQKEELPLSESQRKALDSVIRGENVFITGCAGNGKSFLIERIKTELAEMGKVFYVTGMTGGASYNVGGVTLHSFAGIGLGDKELNIHLKNIRSNGRDKVERWKKTEVLIIDEVSMLKPGFLEKINQLAKILRNRKNVAFGGIQIILVGDFAQIPPIADKVVDTKQSVLTEVGTQYAFHTATWRELNLTMIKMDTNFRQQDDETFKALLGAIRIGTPLTNKEDALLRSRDISNKDIKVAANATKLFSYRNDVLRTNTEALSKIDGNSVFYDAEIYMCPALERKNAMYGGSQSNMSDFNNTKYPVETRVELRVGASVLLRFNMSPSTIGLFNGSRGVITKFVDITPKEEEEEEEEDGTSIKKKKSVDATVETCDNKAPQLFPLVRFDNGETRLIKPHTWSAYEGKTLVSSFTQIPLSLAYALTIHQAQGLTLDAALVDMRVFSTGQLYVALSRVRRIENLYLTNSHIKQKILADTNVIAFLSKHHLL